MTETKMTPPRGRIDAAAKALAGRVVRTPCADLAMHSLQGALPAGADVSIKLELFQHSGSFKARGVLLGIDGLPEAQRRRGVVAASGGNHALAVSWGAKAADIPARVFMPRATDPIRIEGCRALGAEVELTDDIAAAFAGMETAAEQDGLAKLHPYEGEHMTLGAATCGMEYIADRPDREVFIVPVGGGGLISGMAAAIRHAKPAAEIWGVEPEGADSLGRSLAAGKPVTLDRVSTIADSLGAPYALPYSLAVARENVTGMVTVSDDEMRAAMRLLFDGCRLVAEPACAASLAGLVGPLRAACEGRRVGIIACGSNISIPRYQALLDDTGGAQRA